MRKLTGAAALFALLIATACAGPDADSGRIAGPNQPSANIATGGACTNLAGLLRLGHQAFDGGSPGILLVFAKLLILNRFETVGNTANAQATAQQIVTFVQSQASKEKLNGTPAQIDAFITAVRCFAGLSGTTFLVQPSDTAQVLSTSDGTAGIALQANTVTVPTVITITNVDPNGPSGLDTKLDQYPTYIAVTTSSPLTDSAVVAVCIPASLGLSQQVFDRLRLGHQASTGFEIAPPADPSFLNCPTAQASTSKLPHWLQDLASLVLPKPLYAGTMFFASGGVGGAAINFSPFGAVDKALFATGGVGGAAINFQRMPSFSRSTAPAGKSSGTSGTSAATKNGSTAPAYSVYDANGNCVSADTTAGLPLSPLCRPVITVMTAKGTIITGVPVSWAVTAGGGTIAADTLTDGACGLFAGTASNTTDVNGKAGVCWTLGASAGTNTVTATPTFGGDAPNGVVFVDASGNLESGVQFNATADLIPTTATATGVTAIYDGLAHAGSGSCSNNLTPAYSYNTIDGSAPTAAGSYTLTVTCGGSAPYLVSTNTAPVVITQAASTTAVSCPASIAYSAGTNQNPCTATATGPGGLSTPQTVAYTPSTLHDAGAYTATATFAGDGNHSGSTGSSGFTITKIPATATAGSGTMIYGGSVPALPCTVGGLLAPDAGAVSCTTSVPGTIAAGVNITTPVLVPSAPVDYAVSPSNGTLTVRYLQSQCFTFPLSQSPPSTAFYVKQGLVVPVVCWLKSANGALVGNATGNITVQDMGAAATGPGTVVFQQDNAFQLGLLHDYEYWLSTSSLLSGHYYLVTATWNDGSTTTGWFYLK